jgi:hypothetical protein
MFFLFASDRNDIGLDHVIGVQCRLAGTPRAVLESDVLIKLVF